MDGMERFSHCTTKVTLLALVILSARVTFAAPDIASQHKTDCKIYEQQEEANLEAQRRVDPSIQAARLDTVFYSAKRNSCLASVFFSKGGATYGAIIDMEEGRMLWAKSYKGRSFTPAHIVEMDREMDDEIRALELEPETAANSRPLDFLPLLPGRTMNTLPAIKNALAEER